MGEEGPRQNNYQNSNDDDDDDEDGNLINTPLRSAGKATHRKLFDSSATRRMRLDSINDAFDANNDDIDADDENDSYNDTFADAYGRKHVTCV